MLLNKFFIEKSLYLAKNSRKGDVNWGKKSLSQRVLEKKCVELDHLERCRFLCGVRHDGINIFGVFLDVAKYWPFLL